MTEVRPDPDQVLQRLREQTTEPHRGKLKIFLGYAAGVGKTYAMLEAAREQAMAGVDLVLGYVEPHPRFDTGMMTLGLDILATKQVEYRGIVLNEFDLDTALARKPAILVVDELAHTNAPGLRHAKRWQDIEELLDAGISVYSTLNVQHVESLNDVVAQITGIRVRETIPDKMYEEADSVELVDIPPEDLLQRFSEGKVYVPTQAEHAMQKFFRLPNLTALRELALRVVADRVNVQVQTARSQEAETKIWATHERLLVCIGPSPTSARIVRVAKRMATSLRAPWIVAYVDTGATLSDAATEALRRNVKLAEQLGAETVTLNGENLVAEIVKYAHDRNITKIIIGKTGQPRWRELLGVSVVSRLIRESGDVDVYVIRGKEEPTEGKMLRPTPAPRRLGWAMLGKAIGICIVSTLLAWMLNHWRLTEANLVMVYLLGVAYVAARYGRSAGVLASVLSVLAFDFCFVPPQGTFAVADTQYLITFAIMLVISLLISTLAHRIRRQAESARQSERQTEILYHLSQKLAATAGLHQLIAEAEEQLAENLNCEVSLFVPDDARRLKATTGSPAASAADDREVAVAQWVFEHDQAAGAGTDTLHDAKALYVPLTGRQGMVGVLALRPARGDQFNDPEKRHLIEALSRQIAVAVERERLAEKAQKMLVKADMGRRPAPDLPKDVSK